MTTFVYRGPSITGLSGTLPTGERVAFSDEIQTTIEVHVEELPEAILSGNRSVIYLPQPVMSVTLTITPDEQGVLYKLYKIEENPHD